MFFLTFWNFATFLPVLFMCNFRDGRGVFNWGRCVYGGVVSLSHFHVIILYFSGSAHTQIQTNTHTHAYTPIILRVSTLTFSCFLFSTFLSNNPNVTKITVCKLNLIL